MVTTRPGEVTTLEALELMVALLDGDWNHAGRTEQPVRREASGLVAAHLQWHLERGLRSLPLVDRTNVGERSR